MGAILATLAALNRPSPFGKALTGRATIPAMKRLLACLATALSALPAHANTLADQVQTEAALIAPAVQTKAAANAMSAAASKCEVVRDY